MNIEEQQTEYKRLAEARLSIIPEDAVLSVGSYGEFTRDQILKEIEEDSEVGKKMIEIQIKYLQMLKEGILYGNNTDN
jgi:hypothetical protein